jgi:hypothetical protein
MPYRSQIIFLDLHQGRYILRICIVIPNHYWVKSNLELQNNAMTKFIFGLGRYDQLIIHQTIPRFEYIRISIRLIQIWIISKML